MSFRCLKQVAFATALAMPLLTAVPGAYAQTAPVTSATGSLEQSHGQWRSSKLVGATVYNDQGTSIGTVNDMLVGSDGKVSNVLISVGGFLGVGSKYVEVPFGKLKFEPSKSNPASSTTAGTSTAASAANGHNYSVVLPGVTKDALTAMTGFTY